MLFAGTKKAFTLAEIMLTLALIGIVISITLPVLINKNLEEQRKAGVKTSYAILSNVLLSINKDNGTIKGLCNNGDSVCIKNEVKKNIKYLIDCNSNIVASGCWKTEQFMDGTAAGVGTASALALNNGKFFMFNWISSSCQNSGNDTCGWAAVDINGAKGPNRWGQDTFAFHITEFAIKPYGISGDSGNLGTCNKSDSGLYSGLGCTVKYLTESD